MHFDRKLILDEIKYQGLSQPMLSERTKRGGKKGISVSWINKILRGVDEGSPKAVKSIADALGLDMRQVARRKTA